MNICRFDDPKVFQDRILDFLIHHEAENNLPLGILNNVISGEYRHEKPYLGCVEKNDVVQIAALCTPPFPAILSFQDPPPDDDVIEIILADMIDFLEGRFTGISGNKPLVARMKVYCQELTGRKPELKMAMRIYKLDKVVPTDGIPGRIRPATEEDRKIMQDWYSEFHLEAVQEEADPEKVQSQVDMYLEADPKSRGLYFWERNGIPVSMAGYAGPTPNGIRIGAVYTPPDQRKNGYASAVTAGLSEYLLNSGFKFIFLFTDLLNPTSNHIYQEIGYQPVCDVDRYDFV